MRWLSMALLVLIGWAGSLSASEGPSSAWNLPPVSWFAARMPSPPEPHSFRDRIDVRHTIAVQSAAREADFRRAVASNEFNVFFPPNAWFLARIPPPFTAGSDGDRADLEYSCDAQAAATPEQVAHANATSRFTVFSFADVLGPGFAPADYPETAVFFVRLADTANGPKNFLKDTFRRERPFRGHPEAIRRLVPDEDGFSYPSGHSTRSRLFARVLGELDPAKLDAFLKCGDDIANDRIIGGMHYRSDVLASWKLGDLLFAELMKDPGFVKDLAGLKKSEWSGREPATGGRKSPDPQRPEEPAATPSAVSSGTK